MPKKRQKTIFNSPHHVTGLLTRLASSIRGILTQFHTRAYKKHRNSTGKVLDRKSNFVMLQNHLDTNYSPLITTRHERREIVSVFLPNIGFSRPFTKRIMFFVASHVLYKISTVKSAYFNTFYLSCSSEAKVNGKG